MTLKQTMQFKKLAADVAEPIHQMASRLVEQIIDTIHESHIAPLKSAIASAIHELNYHNPERAKEILRNSLM